MPFRFRSLALIACSYFCMVLTSNADTITYGDFESDGMFFTGVYESSADEALPLFGAPSVIGESLVFNSPSFAATATNGSLEFIDGRMGVDISAKPGGSIHSLRLSEFGSYLATGDNVDLSAGAIAFATANGQLYSGSFQFISDSAGVGKWDGSVYFEFDQPAQSVSLVLDNQLFANAGLDSSAVIGKEGISVTINSVPEPTGTLLGIASLLALAGSRRRRSA